MLLLRALNVARINIGRRVGRQAQVRERDASTTVQIKTGVVRSN